jgi:hypothetical protein
MLKNRFVSTLAVSAILVLPAGCLNQYAYLTYDGRITYPVLMGHGRVASDILWPGRKAARAYMSLAHSFALARVSDPNDPQLDPQPKFSAIGIWLLTLSGSICRARSNWIPIPPNSSNWQSGIRDCHQANGQPRRALERDSATEVGALVDKTSETMAVV